MKKYIFLTDEGYTFQPDGENESVEVENLQVIGFAEGANADEAYENLLRENPSLKDTTFEDVFCYQLDEDYKRTRNDYNLKLQ